jgi:prepilin-type N-terminal cleavage/methylation domain-containing protein
MKALVPSTNSLYYLTMRYIESSSPGFSLIEMLIVLGLAGIAMIGLMSMGIYSSRMNRTVALSASFNDSLSLTRMVLSSAQCPTSLQDASGKKIGISLTADSPIEQIYAGGTPILVSGTNTNGVQITKLYLSKKIDLNPSSNQYIMSLHIDAQKVLGPSASPSQPLSADIPLLVTLDTSTTPNQIRSCSLNPQTQLACVTVGYAMAKRAPAPSGGNPNPYIANSVNYTDKTVTDVAKVVPYPTGAKSYWGLECATGWALTSCDAATHGVDTTEPTDHDTWISNNQCLADDEEAAYGSGYQLYATCCKTVVM